MRFWIHTNALRAVLLSGLGILLCKGVSYAEPPIIIEDPQNQTVQMGRIATFRVRATGTPTLRYQWFKDGNPIQGAESAEYSIPAASILDDESRYYCRVSNNEGSAQSRDATLFVFTPAVQINREAGEWGTQVYYVPTSREVQEMARLGVKWSRIGFYPEKTPALQGGGYDFTSYDRAMNEFHVHGIRIIALLSGSHEAPPRTDQEIADYTRWVRAIVDRYRGRGVVFDFWNEPDGDPWYSANPVVYAKVVKAVGKVIKSNFPNEIFTAGGFVDVPQHDPFVRTVFENGIARYLDVVSIHPYKSFFEALPPETAASSYDRLRAIITPHIPPGKNLPFINSEFGVPSEDGPPGYDEEYQAKVVVRHRFVEEMYGVRISQWYMWRDAPELNSEDPWEENCGLVQGYEFPPLIFQYKPAYFAALQMNRVLKDAVFQRRLSVGGSNDYVLLYAEGAAETWIAWTVNGTSQVNIPLPPGRYELSDHLGNPPTIVTVGAGGYNMTLTDGPQYIVREGRPAITQDPRNQTVQVGTPVTFSVQARGAPTLRYQWFKNGAPIANANSPDYTISFTALTDDEARYKCRVWNDMGEAFSAEATLLVLTPAVPFDFRLTFGLQIRNEPSAKEMESWREVGVEWIRWGIAPEQAPPVGGSYNFSVVDRGVEALKRNGFKVIMDIATDDPPRTAPQRAALARLINHAVRRYQGKGILWQFFYETDNPFYWGGRADAAEYMAALKEVARAIKTDFPNEVLMGPALVTAASNQAYLLACLEMGLLRYVDVFTVHPYLWETAQPEEAMQWYQHFRRLISQYTPDGRNISMADHEIGFPSGLEPYASPEAQAKMLPRQYFSDVLSNVTYLGWYMWRDLYVDEGETPYDTWANHCGLVEKYRPASPPAEFQKKLSYFAALTMNRFRRGFQFDQRMSIAGANNYVLRFSKNGPIHRYVAWTSERTSQSAVIAGLTGEFWIYDHLGRNPRLMQAGPSGLAVTLTDAVQYIVPNRNEAPIVDAGLDQTIALPASVSLTGRVTDDGMPDPPGRVASVWSKVSGPGSVTFGNANGTATNATFGSPGTYVLRLTADDGGGQPQSDDLQIRVNPSQSFMQPRLNSLETGINLHDWFWLPGLGDDYYRRWYTDQDLQLVRDFGFRHVRLLIHPHFAANPLDLEQLNLANLRHVENALSLIHSKGLSASLAPIVYEEQFWTDLRENPAFRAKFAGFWRNLARHFNASNPESTFFEVINEPDLSQTEWQPVLEQLARAIREGAPNHTIVAPFGSGGSLENVNQFRPLPDTNVIYDFHMYTPIVFCTQGATWLPGHEHVRGLPYPNPDGPDNPVIRQLLRTVQDPQARALIQRYAEERWDTVKLYLYLSAAREWADRHQAPVRNGEFGVMKPHALQPDRLRFLSEVRGLLEQDRVPWSFFSFREAEFGIITKNGPDYTLADVDFGALEALGLSPAPMIPASGQPANATVTVNQSATFRVIAYGVNPLTYAWQESRDNGQTWSAVGTNQNSYTINNVPLNFDGRKYRCRVTAGNGQSTVSNIATLTVVPPTYTLTVTNGSGSGTYPAATVVNIAANTPPAGQIFDRWTGPDVSAVANPLAPSTTLTMPARNAAVTATYKAAPPPPPPNYTLTINKAGTGDGTVTLNPPGGTYSARTPVTLTATPQTGSVFAGWSGDLTGSQNPATIVMNGNKTVTARFDLANRAPSITSGPNATPNPALVGQVVNFSVTAMDPDEDPLTYDWEFGDGGTGSGANVTHTYTAAGVYTVRVTVRDGRGGTATGTLAMTVNNPPPSPPQNQAPEVNAGTDQTITLPSVANLNATVTDDGLPNPPGQVTVLWSKVSGPGMVSFANQSAVDTAVGFTAPGLYVLRLTADDGEMASFDEVWITVNDGRTAPPGFPTDDDIKVFPNPLRLGSDKQSFTLSNLGTGAEIDIYDRSGSLLDHYSTDRDSIQIDATGWQSGIYIFHIKQRSGGDVRRKAAVIK